MGIHLAKLDISPPPLLRLPLTCALAISIFLYYHFDHQQQSLHVKWIICVAKQLSARCPQGRGLRKVHRCVLKCPTLLWIHRNKLRRKLLLALYSICNKILALVADARILAMTSNRLAIEQRLFYQ